MTSKWQPIETAPKDRDIWVCGFASVWTSSDAFLWQGQAGFSEKDGLWWTTSCDDSGQPLKVIPTHWVELLKLPELPQLCNDYTEKFVDQVIDANSQAVIEFIHGSEKAFNSLVGQVMKLSGGSVNPETVISMIRSKISIDIS